MQNLKIDDGSVRLSINDDDTRIISFNPKDELFAEKFYLLLTNFRSQIDKFSERAEEVDRVDTVDEDGIPTNIRERIALLKDVCSYMREQIDMVFGQGTSQTAFGDAYNLDMFEQFFDGITPFIKDARTEKVKKYLPPKHPKPRKRR